MPVLDTGRWGQVLLPEPGRYGEEMKTLRLANRQAELQNQAAELGLENYERIQQREDDKVSIDAANAETNRLKADTARKQYLLELTKLGDEYGEEAASAVQEYAVVGAHAYIETGSIEEANKRAAPVLDRLPDKVKKLLNDQDQIWDMDDLSSAAALDDGLRGMLADDDIQYVDKDGKIHSVSVFDREGRERLRNAGMKQVGLARFQFDDPAKAGIRITGDPTIDRQIAAAEVASNQMRSLGTNVFKQVLNAREGATGFLSGPITSLDSAVNAVRSTMNVLGGLDEYRVGGDEGEIVPLSTMLDHRREIYADELSVLEKIAGEAAGIRSNIMRLAFIDAKAMEPSNRGLSDKDIENALQRIIASTGVGGGSKNQMLNALQQTMYGVADAAVQKYDSYAMLGGEDIDIPVSVRERWQMEREFWGRSLQEVIDDIKGMPSEDSSGGTKPAPTTRQSEIDAAKQRLGF